MDIDQQIKLAKEHRGSFIARHPDGTVVDPRTGALSIAARSDIDEEDEMIAVPIVTAQTVRIPSKQLHGRRLREARISYLKTLLHRWKYALAYCKTNNTKPYDYSQPLPDKRFFKGTPILWKG